MSDRDDDEGIALLEGVKTIFCRHVDDEQEEVDAADNCHGAKAAERGFHRWHSNLLTYLSSRRL